ncbi:Fe-S oxidoreductase [Mycetocola reblochoni]|uniref:Fe-S oxidoreductase n=1 Tax=Mycetocola reblochoni TaxID=331618 RepID=UPI001FE24DFC|nr:Fe-S oxidoreductase [Mycetocola reblochoni]
MRRLLFDSPVSLAGYAIATAIGAAWGTLWSTGRIVRRDGLIVFTGLPRWAYRRGGICVGACYLTGGTVSPAVLRHEAVHKAQWRRYGLAFPLLNLLAGAEPTTNRFEIEAGLTDGGYLRRRPKSAGASTRSASTPDSSTSTS